MAHRDDGPGRPPGGARRFALALARSMQLALLVEHAQWALDAEGDQSFVAMARRLGRTPIGPIIAEPTAEIDAILAAAEGGPTDEQP